MKRITEEMLGLSGFRCDGCAHHNALELAASRLCFDNSNPLKNFYNLVSWEVCRKADSETNFIIFEKTNNRNITKNY